jgi:hypothetical protein
MISEGGLGAALAGLSRAPGVAAHLVPLSPISLAFSKIICAETSGRGCPIWKL